MTRFLVIIAITVSLLAATIAADSNSLLLSGPYLGQTPPGMTPTRFGLGILEDDLHGCPVFTPDGMEVYWSTMEDFKMRYAMAVDGNWTILADFEFPVEFEWSDSPILTPDGNRLFFKSLGPVGASGEQKENIWFMDRNDTGWNSPQLLSEIVNTLSTHWQVSVADNGNLYFFSHITGDGDIYLSRFVDSAYTEPELVGPPISGELLDLEPFIAPDESYLILSRVDNAAAYPYADLYISFKDYAGNWTEAVPMEELNTTYHELGANVTRDGLYLFYLGSTNQGLSAHWVSAEVIEHYRPTMFTRRYDVAIVADTLNNQGANWVDYNNDGFDDLFVTHLDDNNQLFANNGDGSFTEISGDVIVSEGGSENCSWGDFDNNGYMEPHITNAPAHVAATDYFYLNDGDGSFTKVTDDTIVNTVGYSGATICADYDNDGNLDLYVVDIGATPGDSPWTDRLFRGDGTGHFTRIDTGAIVNSYGNMSSGGSWSDYDNDGDQDLLLLKVDTENMLFRNDGTSFTLITGENFLQDNVSSSAANWGDYDNDGDLDLFVANYYFGNPNSLYENQGDGSFVAVTNQDIVTDSGWTTSSCWVDLNNDGYLDMYVVQDQWSAVSSDCIYMNDGSGGFIRLVDSGFVDIPGRTSQVSTVDYDKDGDIDLFLSNTYADEPDVLYQNNTNNNGNWISIECIGTSSNCAAIGTKVRIKATFDSSPQWQLREINTQTGGTSRSSIRAHFGLDDATIIDSLVVEWPSGMTRVLTNVEANQFLTITESCCGLYTDGFTGNADCDSEGKRNLADITRLIDRVYISKVGLCCEENGDTDGDALAKINLADITRLIDHTYISKAETAACD